MSRTTIYTGLAGLKVVSPVSPQQIPARIRAAGGGRKKRTAKDVNLLRNLEALLEPASRGDPMSPLHWTCKSTSRLAEELKQQGHEISQRTVCDLLSRMDYMIWRLTLAG